MKKIVLTLSIVMLLGSCVFAYGENLYSAYKATFPIYINGNRFESEQPTITVNGTTYLPLKSMGQALNVSVVWNNDTRSVEVTQTDSVAIAQIKVVSLMCKQFHSLYEVYDVMDGYGDFMFDNIRKIDTSYDLYGNFDTLNKLYTSVSNSTQATQIYAADYKITSDLEKANSFLGNALAEYKSALEDLTSYNNNKSSTSYNSCIKHLETACIVLEDAREIIHNEYFRLSNQIANYK